MVLAEMIEDIFTKLLL